MNIGPGSPVGATFGTSAKFPAKYQRALFAADWTYGTLYAIHLTPAGATFIALPMKIENGSGAPARIVAVMP